MVKPTPTHFYFPISHFESLNSLQYLKLHFARRSSFCLPLQIWEKTRRGSTQGNWLFESVNSIYTFNFKPMLYFLFLCALCATVMIMVDSCCLTTQAEDTKNNNKKITRAKVLQFKHNLNNGIQHTRWMCATGTVLGFRFPHRDIYKCNS